MHAVCENTGGNEIGAIVFFFNICHGYDLCDFCAAAAYSERWACVLCNGVVFASRCSCADLSGIAWATEKIGGVGDGGDGGSDGEGGSSGDDPRHCAHGTPRPIKP